MASYPVNNHARPPGPWVRDAAIIGLATFLVISWQLVYPGHYYLADDDAAMLTKYVPQFMESFRQGVYYPRWMADDFGGYGSSVFVFYSPLLYCLAALVSFAGLGPPASASLIETVRLFLGSYFVYLLIAEKHGVRAALMSSLFYLLLPARVMDIYYWNSPAGRFSEAFIPMSAYYTLRYMDEPFSRSGLFKAGASYACLVLSHLVTAFVFTPFLAAFGLFASASKPGARLSLKLFLALSTGLCMASFFFVPVVFERGLTHIELLGRFTYHENFLFWPGAGIGVSGREPIRLMIRNIVAKDSLILTLLLFMAWKYAGLKLSKQPGFFLAASGACLFMMSSLSSFLWKYIPGLSTVQFPSRFEPLNIFFVSALTGIALNALLTSREHSTVVKTFLAVVLLTVFIVDAKLVISSQPYNETDAVEIARKMELPEYLPISTDIGILPNILEKPSLSSNDKFDSRIIKWGQAERSFRVTTPNGARVRVKTFYFPGWRAWVDGKETSIGVEDKSGAMLIHLPPGRHEVELRFTDTTIRTAGAAVSFLTVLLLILPYGRLSGLSRRG